MADDIAEELIAKVQKKPRLFYKSKPPFQEYFKENGYMENNQSYPQIKW